MQSLPQDLKDCLDPKRAFIFSKSYCPYCELAKLHLTKLQVPFDYAECDLIPFSEEQKQQLREMTGVFSFPNIFIGTKSIGGYDDMIKLEKEGRLKIILNEEGVTYQQLS